MASPEQVVSLLLIQYYYYYYYYHHHHHHHHQCHYYAANKNNTGFTGARRFAVGSGNLSWDVRASRFSGGIVVIVVMVVIVGVGFRVQDFLMV